MEKFLRLVIEKESSEIKLIRKRGIKYKESLCNTFCQGHESDSAGNNYFFFDDVER